MSDFIDNLMEVLIEKLRGIKILFYGMAGIGKSSLASALLTGDSSAGVSGPCHGTRAIQTQYEESIDLTVYDTPGLNLDTVDHVISQIAETCHPNNMNCIFVCFGFNERFDERLLTALHELNPEVWNRVVFVLTKSDELPATYKRKDDETKKLKIAETKQQWQLNLKETLQICGVNQAILENIQVVFTTHTDEEEHMDWELYGEEANYNSRHGLQNGILRLILISHPTTNGAETEASVENAMERSNHPAMNEAAETDEVSVENATEQLNHPAMNRAETENATEQSNHPTMNGAETENAMEHSNHPAMNEVETNEVSNSVENATEQSNHPAMNGAETDELSVENVMEQSNHPAMNGAETEVSAENAMEQSNHPAMNGAETEVSIENAMEQSNHSDMNGAEIEDLSKPHEQSKWMLILAGIAVGAVGGAIGGAIIAATLPASIPIALSASIVAKLGFITATASATTTVAVSNVTVGVVAAGVGATVGSVAGGTVAGVFASSSSSN